MERFENLADVVAELVTLEINKRRKDADVAAKQKKRRIDWERAAKSVSVIVTTLSVAGAVIVFLVGEKDKRDLQRSEISQERRASISKFAIALAQPETRQAAAFAVATLGEAESVPLLMHHLRVALREENPTFSDALIQALGSLRDASGSRAVLRLNKSAEGLQVMQENRAIVDATSDLLWDKIVAGQDFNGISLDGVTLRNVSLSYGITKVIDAPAVRFVRSSGCRPNIPAANFERAKFFGLVLDGGDLRDANFAQSFVDDAEFKGTNLSNTNFAEAKLSSVIFRDSDLKNADFSRSELSDIDFVGSDLTGTDFSDADLWQVQFVRMSDQESGMFSDGAVVANADFSRAGHFSDVNRTYLCMFGALNVPGGCSNLVPMVKSDEISEGFGSGCF